MSIQDGEAEIVEDGIEDDFSIGITLPRGLEFKD